jgi:serine protease Do
MRRVCHIGWAVFLVALLSAGMIRPVSAQAQEIQYNQAQMIRSLLPTVVNIIAHANAAAGGPAMAASQESHSFELKSSAGSGFIVDPDGVIVTNWHVLDGAYEIFVTFSDGTRVTAKVLNAARILDIALLKVDVGHTLPAITWGNSAKMQIGDPVLAIGNPLGIGLSVTAGIVSALNRNIMDTPYDDFIQTDAPINHGNSGGPLFNLQGEVIGINTALISPTAGSAGLGFAIPSDLAHHVIERLQTYGWTRPGFLGVKVQQVTPEMALGLGMQKPEGSIVAWVTQDGPADKAGVQVGDVILRFGDEAPTDERDLLRKIAGGTPGEKVRLAVLRDGKPLDIPVTLGEWPRMAWEERDAPTVVAPPHWNAPPDLGVQVAALTDKLAAANEIPPHAEGTKAVLVTAVAQDAEAAHSGVSVGDLILRVNNDQIGSASDWLHAIAEAHAENRTYAMVLLFPKASSDTDLRVKAPKWVPVRIVPQ